MQTVQAEHHWAYALWKWKGSSTRGWGGLYRAKLSLAGAGRHWLRTGGGGGRIGEMEEMSFFLEGPF
jgi:hypothetical protein